MRKTLLASAGVAATALLLAIPTASSAASAAKVKVVSTNVVVPFNLAINKGRVLVADGGSETIGLLHRNGTVTTKVSNATGTSGVAISKHGRYLAYTTTEGGQGGITGSGLHVTGPWGYQAFADTLAYEKANNPDSTVSYGVDSPSDCVTEELAKVDLKASYEGLVDSHAYSVSSFKGKWIVADAGGNDLLEVTSAGKIKTLTVFPAHATTITQEAATAFNLKDCVVGQRYKFEAVPTDVEVGRDGFLYVTTLPGGPESDVLGARGKVWRVNPKTGQKRVVASGLAGPTNLAIGSKGAIYVAEFFAGRVVVIKDETIRKVVDLPGVVSIERDQKTGALWAGTVIFAENGPPTGSIVKITR